MPPCPPLKLEDHALAPESVLKTALDELRMQMVGVQVLFGFQLQVCSAIIRVSDYSLDLESRCASWHD